MRLAHAFLRTKFYWPHLLIIIVGLLGTEGIFSWIFIRNSIIIEAYTKVLALVIYGYLIFKLPILKKTEQVLLIAFTLVMVRLVIESLQLYGSFFKQFTMFNVFFPVLYVFFVKYLLRTFDMDLLPFMAKFYLAVYFVFMILFGRGFSFSLEMVEMTDYGPFSGDSRIIHASHIFMLIIPLLWYLHAYIESGQRKNLLWLFICIGIILVHQHRSVWSSALIALFFYFIAAIRNKYLKAGKIVQLFIGGLGVAALVYFFVSNLVPGFIDFLSDRFSEILNPAKEGSTGNFRLEQRETYFQLFLQRPWFGWTFEGFEMPNPLVDWWPSMTGQHFHEGYMEMLFYHGIVGLVFKYGVLFYLLIKSFSRKLSPNAIILISFSVAGLVFSLNYVLPLIFWGMVGMCLFYLELSTDYKNNKKPDELYLHLDMC